MCVCGWVGVCTLQIATEKEVHINYIVLAVETQLVSNSI